MDQYTLFESYLSNRLSREAAASFEQNLKEDKLMQAAFDAHLITQASMDILLEDDIKTVIADIDFEEATISKTGNSFKWKVYLAAACIAGLLVLGTVVLNMNANNASPEEMLFAEFYNPPMGEIERGENKNVIGPSKMTSKGHELLKNKKYKAAAIEFQSAVLQLEGSDKQRAEWFLALSLLSNDKENAIALLKTIAANPDHNRHIEATKILADPRIQ